MFKLVDFQCESCQHIQEVLLDKRTDADNQEVTCEECGSKDMKTIISVGNGKGGHVSWSKWRVGLGD